MMNQARLVSEKVLESTKQHCILLNRSYLYCVLSRSTSGVVVEQTSVPSDIVCPTYLSVQMLTPKLG